VLPKSHVLENRRHLKVQIILAENQNAPQVNLARHVFLAFANGGLGNTPFRFDPISLSASLQSETSSAKSSIMSDPAHVPAILQEPRRVRYLKLIALFKIGKGVLLLLLGASLLFLNARDRWMGALFDWTYEEILLGHSKGVHFLLSKMQDVLAGGALRATGFLALFYCAVLFTEGIGVYFQKRWAELLMIFATATLIPLEVQHLWHRLVFHRPGLAVILLSEQLTKRDATAALLILLANCFIVWFLYRVLKRDKAEAIQRPPAG
jgi:uncharacterized membrane protein (DUF2068 family)